MLWTFQPLKPKKGTCFFFFFPLLIYLLLDVATHCCSSPCFSGGRGPWVSDQKPRTDAGPLPSLNTNSELALPKPARAGAPLAHSGRLSRAPRNSGLAPCDKGSEGAEPRGVPGRGLRCQQRRCDCIKAAANEMIASKPRFGPRGQHLGQGPGRAAARRPSGGRPGPLTPQCRQRRGREQQRGDEDEGLQKHRPQLSAMRRQRPGATGRGGSGQGRRLRPRGPGRPATVAPVRRRGGRRGGREGQATPPSWGHVREPPYPDWIASGAPPPSGPRAGKSPPTAGRLVV